MGFKSHVKMFTSFASVLLHNIYTVHLTELAIFGTAEAQLLGSTVSQNTWHGLLEQRNFDKYKVDHNFSKKLGDKIKHILYGLDKLKVAKMGLFKSNQ